MKLFISSDAHWESRLGQVLDELTDHKFRQHFEGQDYGTGLAGVSVIFMCRDPSYSFMRRVRFTKKDKNLHLDIMLDLPTMKAASPEDRKRVVAQPLFDEVPEVLVSYKIPDFNKDAFAVDLRRWIDGMGWRRPVAIRLRNGYGGETANRGR
jgi:hypothetical protein